MATFPSRSPAVSGTGSRVGDGVGMGAPVARLLRTKGQLLPSVPAAPLDPSIRGFTNAAAEHPLDPLLPRELEAAAELATQGLEQQFQEPVWAIRFAEIVLHEPPKDQVMRYTGRSRVEAEHSWGIHRCARIQALSLHTVKAYVGVVDLTAKTVLSIVHVPDVQPAMGHEEYTMCEAIVRAYPGFRDAVTRAGYNPDLVMIDPWSMGYYGPDDGPKRRLVWALMYYKVVKLMDASKEDNLVCQERPEDNTYARPLEGMRIVVDTVNREVVEFKMEAGGVKVAAPDLQSYMEYAPPSAQRQDVKDLIILQPEGPSFTVSGQHLHWQGWDLRVGFTPQEGLVLHSMAIMGRPVCYRMSLAEMVVPYGDPKFPHYKKNAFDGGEDGLGRNAHSLALGCDCLGQIHYMDAHMPPIKPGGEPHTIRQAICIHEEDAGIAWKHKDWRTDTSETRRSRRLVLSFMCTIGNYDYAFYFQLYQDGMIEVEIKLTGILSVGSLEEGETHRKYGTTLHQFPSRDGRSFGLFAPIHQHIFVARMDMAVDGPRNRVVEIDSVAETEGDHNPWHSGFHTVEKVLPTELQACRNADLSRQRYWVIQSSERKSRVGKPTGYKLLAKDPVHMMTQPKASLLRRAGFMRHHLWVTRFNPEHRYPAGDFPNQNPHADNGLSLWAQEDKNIVDTDLVVWHVFGAHHVPRLEDWPIMPVEKVSMMLKPYGFFDVSPVLDLPASSKQQLALSHSNNTERGNSLSDLITKARAGTKLKHDHILTAGRGRGPSNNDEDGETAVDCCSQSTATNGGRTMWTGATAGSTSPSSGGREEESLKMRSRL